MGKVFELADGLGTELGVVSIILIIVITIFFMTKLDMIKLPGSDKKPKTLIRYNPHPPGSAKVCGEHTTKLVRIETKIEGIEGDITEIKGDIKEINKRRV